MGNPNVFTAVLVAACLTGCGSTAEHLRSQPTTNFIGQAGASIDTSTKLPPDLRDYVKLRCVKAQDTPSARLAAQNNGTTECLYVTTEVSDLMGLPKAQVGDAVTYLMAISDMNCSNFKERAYANRTGFEFAKGVTSNVATGASALAAFSNPVASATLGVSNLIMTSGVDAFNHSYYLEQTWKAVEASMDALRAAKRSEIEKRVYRQDPREYATIAEAISDIRAYDDACTLNRAVDNLNDIANDAKKAAEGK